MPAKPQENIPTTTEPIVPTDNGGTIKKLAAVVVVVLIIAAGFFYKDKLTAGGQVLGVDTDYQAVFLTNGQVYFGKLEANNDWVKLTDIYYLQVTQQLQPADNKSDTQTQQPNIQLVKLGSELHGPKDEMNIDRDKILFWENMKDDSKVVQAIHKYQETKK